MTPHPLDGFVVGVTADRRAAEQAELLRRRGAEVVHGPVIATRYLVDDDALRRVTSSVLQSRPAYVVATTGIGMRAWLEAAQSWGAGDELVSVLSAARVVARGPKAASATQAIGLPVWQTARGERLADVVELIVGDPARRDGVVVLQRHGGQHDDVIAALRAAGHEVLDVPVYRWERPDDRRPAERLVEAVVDGRVDAVTFTSGPAVGLFLDVAGACGQRAAVERALAGPVVAACVGPVCADAARAHGVTRPVAPDPGRLGTMVRALTEALTARVQEWEVDGVPVVWRGRALAIDGEERRLAPREHAALRALAARPGVVVPGDRVPQWAVARLRRLLGPAGGAVETVPRRGYRFVTDRERVASRPCPANSLSPKPNSSPAIGATRSTSDSCANASCSSAPRSPTSPPT